MAEYKSNSHKSREENNEPIPEKKVEKIISGSVKSKKKSGLQKITNVFIPEDVENVKSYVMDDIVVPAVKDIILDAISAFFGISNSSGGKRLNSSKVSYRKYYEDNNRRDYSSTRPRPGYEHDEIVLDNRGEAEDVISRMDALISTYGIISVADFYEFVGIRGNYTDNKYGWTDIRSAKVVRVSDGYMIRLPKALPLN